MIGPVLVHRVRMLTCGCAGVPGKRTAGRLVDRNASGRRRKYTMYLSVYGEQRPPKGCLRSSAHTHVTRTWTAGGRRGCQARSRHALWIRLRIVVDDYLLRSETRAGNPSHTRDTAVSRSLPRQCLGISHHETRGNIRSKCAEVYVSHDCISHDRPGTQTSSFARLPLHKPQSSGGRPSAV